MPPAAQSSSGGGAAQQAAAHPPGPGAHGRGPGNALFGSVTFFALVVRLPDEEAAHGL